MVGPDGKRPEIDFNNPQTVHERASTDVLKKQIKALEKQIELLSIQLKQLKSTVK